MEVVGNTPVEAPKIVKTFGTYVLAFAMGVWAFGESAGRARAAAELHRQGYTEEAKRLMTGNGDD
jgi:hypothetical protein